jgi:hypothetical protein
MKLELVHPSPWPVHRIGETAPAGAADPSIVIHPLRKAEAHLAPWKHQVLDCLRPPFARADLVSETGGTSALGWPIETVESRITVGDEVLERRISILYFMLEWCGAVVFRASVPRFAAERERAMQILRGARPDWSTDEVVAVAQLFGD